MFYVYIMFSEVNGDIYIGSTANVEARLARHNSGKVRSTKGNRPWRLLEIHEYDTRVGAMRMERYFKTHQQRELIRKRYNLD
ncbi:MAG TPA: endonuclease [Candidatus Veblenbacteria bacterium]|uniref:GIY-YIG domain-containing protein n=3 Tax=Candidatus Vebleniibacteriota TaxID=1817921 RepID=A0A1G2Q3M5_9BACT|nr:MAG: hypothetical protein A2226_01210 [Candidatus Veblenbacteria bacterium RIFOXYA2_FULL_43_9]OHA57641.1 MAG: hypothetical protein A2441_01165 [Candidatus Veblenbacteria bacterium RIFOXYC2_FULL_42_11]HAO81236.1 endonuclease [Candidatus Veblenbacteria bacterium]HBZ36727.1 endonuclease [Candidatus Veblenbacteria bacterium]HCM45433.1 endonuclease [Candidatus Veblenbacteria bacterium]